MPLGVKPICASCQTSDTPIWLKGQNGEVLCNSCGLKQNGNGGGDSKSDTNGKGRALFLGLDKNITREAILHFYSKFK